MRPSVSLLLLLSISANASWFASDKPAYSAWSAKDLKTWLEAHDVPIPQGTYSQQDLQELVKQNWNSASAWTYDQYASAQKSFADIRDSTFDAWDESRLREFLLQQGVVAPKGPREQLVILAKDKYRDYMNAASLFTSQAGASASSAYYGDTGYQATKSLSSITARATNGAARVMNDSKDYVYSTWDDNMLRSYLEDKGVIKTKAQMTRGDMLAKMKDAYASVTQPVWDTWSDSYMHQWLVDHGVVKPDYQTNREALRKYLSNYYYDLNDSVYNTWSDSDLKEWLVQHDIVKSDAQVNRNKMLKMVGDNYSNAKDTFWSTWSDNQLRTWLVDHGYVRSDAQVKRDEMIKIANDKYTDTASRTASYLTWPDARLRAYLRENGVSEDMVPGDRPGLLQETRIRWIQSTNRAESAYSRVRDIINGGVEAAEEKLGRVWEILSGGYGYYGNRAGEAYEAGSDKAGAAYEEGKHRAGGAYEEGKRSAGETYEQGKRSAGETYEQGKRSAEETYEQGKQYAGDRAEKVYKNGKGYVEGGKKYSEEKVRQAGDTAGAGKQYAEEKAGEGKRYTEEKAGGWVQAGREKVGEKVKRAGEGIKGEL